MSPVVLGLDIGGANLKAATADRRAVSVPFALWKQPDRLPTALAELVAKFPDAEEFAVTMTGELCDCFETKRQGVNAILDAVLGVSRSRPVRVWSTDGVFVNVEEARRNHLKVAAANWHATATFAGRYAPLHGGLLLDIGSTTTDIIPLAFGVPIPQGRTDTERLGYGELEYVGVRRTPVCAVYTNRVCAELFATTQDVYVVLGRLPENPATTDTADGRALTKQYSFARLARMLGGDATTLTGDVLTEFAGRVHRQIAETIAVGIRNACHRWSDPAELQTVITSGAGEFLAAEALSRLPRGVEPKSVVSLNDELGPTVSACAPAFALAVLATERQ